MEEYDGTYTNKYILNNFGVSSSSSDGGWGTYNIPLDYDYPRPVSKEQYELLLFQVSELRKRLEEVEERELKLIKMLMEGKNGADDKDAP